METIYYVWTEYVIEGKIYQIYSFFSIKGWSGGVVGMAFVGVVCQKGHGTAINRVIMRSDMSNKPDNLSLARTQEKIYMRDK